LALAKDLLEQARHLALKEPQRPKQASLRRAASAAYYALFHLLVSEGARKLAPAMPPELRTRVQRAFDHNKMRDVCSIYLLPTLPPNAIVTHLVVAPLEPEFRSIADTFVELQEARHSADYDTSRPFDRNDVLQKIDLVERAFSDWNIVKNKPNANVFLAALLLNRHWKK
jgi:hypothetical protein